MAWAMAPTRTGKACVMAALIAAVKKPEGSASGATSSSSSSLELDAAGRELDAAGGSSTTAIPTAISSLPRSRDPDLNSALEGTKGLGSCTAARLPWAEVKARAAPPSTDTRGAGADAPAEARPRPRLTRGGGVAAACASAAATTGTSATAARRQSRWGRWEGLASSKLPLISWRTWRVSASAGASSFLLPGSEGGWMDGCVGWRAWRGRADTWRLAWQGRHV